VQIQSKPVRVLGDRRPAQPLHHDVGLAVRGHATVIQTRHIRMVQPRQDVPLLAQNAPPPRRRTARGGSA
jgi:hypothetical protein